MEILHVMFSRKAKRCTVCQYYYTEDLVLVLVLGVVWQLDQWLKKMRLKIEVTLLETQLVLPILLKCQDLFLAVIRDVNISIFNL